jgi:hypothetical protein
MAHGETRLPQQPPGVKVPAPKQFHTPLLECLVGEGQYQPKGGVDSGQSEKTSNGEVYDLER